MPLHNNVYISQSCLIFNEKGQILTLKRSKQDKTRPGQWDLPGWTAEFEEGHKGDALQSSMLKEIKEETWVKTKNLTEIYVSSKYKDPDFPDNDLRMFVMYLAEFVSGDVKLANEYTDYKRLPIEKFLELDTWPVRERAEKALRILANN